MSLTDAELRAALIGFIFGINTADSPISADGEYINVNLPRARGILNDILLPDFPIPLKKFTLDELERISKALTQFTGEK